jgi:hypothetical protein
MLCIDKGVVFEMLLQTDALYVCKGVLCILASLALLCNRTQCATQMHVCQA